MTDFALLPAIKAYAWDVYQADSSGHGVDHIERVVGLCHQLMVDIASTTPPTDEIDSDVVLAAAYLHDVVDPKVVADPHTARRNLADFLATQPLTPSQVAEICHIIDNMSFSKNIAATQELSLNGQIVQDADRLDAIGAIGIARACYYGGKHGEPLYDPAVPPRELHDEQQYRQKSTVINHFYEKLLTLADTLNTPAARRIGQLRNERMRAFLADFLTEWNGKP